MTLETPHSPTGAEISAQDIVTPRLELISITPAMLRADFAKSPEFPRLIRAEVPAGWPSEGWDEDAYNYLLVRMEKHPHFHGWSRYIAVKDPEAGRRVLAGACGLLCPVELTDDPEIGYGLLPAFQHQGYATEAVAALVAWIFGHPHVRSVNAQSFPDHRPSLGVLARSGFQPAGPGPERGAVLYRRYRE
jgi:RimJ/RimL family protein N-acetyltransferase